MQIKLLYVIGQLVEQRNGNLDGSITIRELLQHLHEMWVYRRRAIASDFHQVIDALKAMDEIYGWIELRDNGTIRLTDEGKDFYNRLKSEGYTLFGKPVLAIT